MNQEKIMIKENNTLPTNNCNEQATTYDIKNSKKKLATDLSALFKIYPMSNQEFISGNVLPPVAIARNYNKVICRMHTIIEDIGHQATFPNLKKQVLSVLKKPALKETKLYKACSNEASKMINKVLKNLRTNCEETFSEFSKLIESFSVARNNAEYDHAENDAVITNDQNYTSMSKEL